MTTRGQSCHQSDGSAGRESALTDYVAKGHFTFFNTFWSIFTG